MTHPLYTQMEARARETFLALMWAFSYPGHAYTLPDTSTHFELIAYALLDLETSFYTPDESLTSILAQTGARALPVEQAAYHFYSACSPRELAQIAQASVGSMQFPDETATLVINCTIGTGPSMTWRGPGIQDQKNVFLSGIPDVFWELRETVCRFPLGWDIYFVDGLQVIGLPRTTQVERAS